MQTLQQNHHHLATGTVQKEAVMHKVFISYHHDNDQWAKDALSKWAKEEKLFIDVSVDTGDIDDNLDDETIRIRIRDEYLRDSTVTILLVGEETKYRKHVDWELYSSMRDSPKNKKSGILVIMLPGSNERYCTAGHGEIEKKLIYPQNPEWVHVDNRQEYERRYPLLPDRIIDNLVKGGAHISITHWNKIAGNHTVLKQLIEWTNQDREKCDYDLSRPMRRRNS